MTTHDSIDAVFKEQQSITEIEESQYGGSNKTNFKQENVFIKFNINKSAFVSLINDVKEVLEYRTITPYPTNNEGHLGIINLRGTIVPIYSQTKNIQETNEVKRIIIFEVDEIFIYGIVATDVKRIYIPEESYDTKELSNGHVITYENIPLKYFDGKYFIQQFGFKYEE